MAVYIENTDIPATQFVLPTSQYANSRVIRWSEQKILTFETYKRGEIARNRNDRFTVLEPGYEYRPDLLSFDVYGTHDFWWRIMEANQIYDVFDFKAGLNIRIPFNLGF